MRPRDDIAHPDAADPLEVIHHLRESQQHWQAAAERIARQRDLYANEAELLEQENSELRRAAQRYLDTIERTPWLEDPRGNPHYDERLAALDDLLDPPDPEQPNPDVASPGRWAAP